MKIATIVGARPQFIKMAPVSLAFRAAGIEELSIHTGQHYDENLSAIFYDQLGVERPRFPLAAGSGTHGAQTARMLADIEPVLAGTRPDRVVVIGDTNSTLAGALVAAKLCLPLAHIEAGLRSHNRRMPEEINRIVADRLADRLYHSTRAAHRNLEREGLLAGARALGDVSLDAVRLFASLPPGPGAAVLDGLPDEFAVLTLHRAETTDDPLRFARVWQRLTELELPLVFPAHPRTRAALARNGLVAGPRMRIIDPLGYPAMLALVQRATLLLTDSGGLQKESCFLETPCLTLRTETEWVETIESGWNRLYDLDACPPIDAGAESRRRGGTIDEYGDGHAAARIVDDLVTWAG